nr:energy transducer TonB [Sphingobium estronivorans]
MVATLATPDSRYGKGRGINVAAVALIIIVHAILIGALIQARQHIHPKREARLSVVNLMPPPPPPAAETPPPPPAKVVAPPPLVQVPVPPVPTIGTTPDIIPVPIAAAPVSTPVPVAAPAPAAAPGIVQGGEIGTQMVAGRPPRYPVESRRKREQGTVVLGLTLAVDGTVESLAITQSSGFPRLDNAARDAVRGWRWRPTIRDGQAVRVRGSVEIPFVLRRE